MSHNAGFRHDISLTFPCSSQHFFHRILPMVFFPLFCYVCNTFFFQTSPHPFSHCFLSPTQLPTSCTFRLSWSLQSSLSCLPLSFDSAILATHPTGLPNSWCFGPGAGRNLLKLAVAKFEIEAMDLLKNIVWTTAVPRSRSLPLPRPDPFRGRTSLGTVFPAPPVDASCTQGQLFDIFGKISCP